MSHWRTSGLNGALGRAEDINSLDETEIILAIVQLIVIDSLDQVQFNSILAERRNLRKTWLNVVIDRLETSSRLLYVPRRCTEHRLFVNYFARNIKRRKENSSNSELRFCKIRQSRLTYCGHPPFNNRLPFAWSAMIKELSVFSPIYCFPRYSWN